MITISIDPVIFSIGHLMIRWYCLIVATAVIVGVWLAAREAERKGFKKEDIYDADVDRPWWTARRAALPRAGPLVAQSMPLTLFAPLYLWEAAWPKSGAVCDRRPDRRHHSWLAAALALPRLLDAVAPGLSSGPGHWARGLHHHR